MQKVEMALQYVTEETGRETRRHPRIALPRGMFVTWLGNDLQLYSRVQTLSMGGLFISVVHPPPLGTKLRLAFAVPGGSVRAEAIVRHIVPGEGIGVEFTQMDSQDKRLLQGLLDRLLRSDF